MHTAARGLASSMMLDRAEDSNRPAQCRSACGQDQGINKPRSWLMLRAQEVAGDECPGWAAYFLNANFCLSIAAE